MFKTFMLLMTSNSIRYMEHWPQLVLMVHLASGIKTLAQSLNHPNQWAKRLPSVVSMLVVKYSPMLLVMTGRKDMNIAIHRKSHSFSFVHVSMNSNQDSKFTKNCNIPFQYHFFSSENHFSHVSNTKIVT